MRSVDEAERATAVEGRVDEVVLPVTFGLRSGTMRLADGRLRYTRKRKSRVVFDAPVGEFHSFARSSLDTGFHLWHGATQYRFIVYEPVVPTELGSGALMDIAEGVDQIARGRAQVEHSRSQVDRWHDALVPAIGSRPAGLRVQPPMSRRRYLATATGCVLLATLIIIAIVTAIVFATS
jgi:hypothetical protein